MAKTELAVAELIWNIIARKTGNVGKVDFSRRNRPFPLGILFLNVRPGNSLWKEQFRKARVYPQRIWRLSSRIWRSMKCGYPSDYGREEQQGHL